jgi:2-polyprenyl-3-methyl-5-hydroxy-6-metoxy-1,4-benzoquinol methylase
VLSERYPLKKDRMENIVIIDQCWCGSENLDNFSEHYYRCRACNTLVCKQRMPDKFLECGDEFERFYGKDYWIKHVKEYYGMPDIFERSRNDLSERCIYWLRDILKYKFPPAKTLELGCAHGGLVFLMKLTGYDSAGTEMSPWICEYASKTFNIPMLCGRVEDFNMSSESYDMILLMDVLEHMTDPVAGLKRIADSLKGDGIAIIQTPCWRETEKTYDEMKSENNSFLSMLVEKEHLYLFNEASIKRILNETGFPHIAFEPQIFPYDMFIFAGKQPLHKIEQEVIDTELQKTPESRMVLALLDVYNQSDRENALLAECETDRAARLDIINRQANEFTEKLNACEADRAARLEVINKQGAEIGELKGRIQQVEAAYWNVVHQKGK